MLSITVILYVQVGGGNRHIFFGKKKNNAALDEQVILCYKSLCTLCCSCDPFFCILYFTVVEDDCDCGCVMTVV